MSSLDNSPQIITRESLVFLGRHRSFGRGVFYLESGAEIQALALEGHGKLREVEAFAPSVNSLGDVVFRAIDAEGRRGIYYVNVYSPGRPVTRLLGQEQNVSTNEPEGSRIIHRRGWPAFSGRPCVTEAREVFVHAVLEASDGSRNHGSAIFQESLLTFLKD